MKHAKAIWKGSEKNIGYKNSICVKPHSSYIYVYLKITL